VNERTERLNRCFLGMLTLRNHFELLHAGLYGSSLLAVFSHDDVYFLILKGYRLFVVKLF
jgi:hypothetical protein